MIPMGRAFLVLVTLLAVAPRAVVAQDNPVLHIHVVLIDADRKPLPVAHHALLISDNPSTAEPRRVVTSADGTADVRLRPGNYTVESDIPVALNGKAYGWTQIVDIAAGHDARLELTVDNAEVTSAAPGSTSATPLEIDDSLTVARWSASVLTLWTPTARASGFVIDADGLVATSQRAIGTATTVDVQVTPAIKVAGTVIVSDATRDVAVLRIDPMAAASVPPVPLACAPAQPPQVASGQKTYPIGGAGGPVLTAGGVVGITSFDDDTEKNRRRDTRIVPIGDACGVVATARAKMSETPAPSGAHLPVEPTQPFPIDALKEIVQRRAGNLNPYQATSASFDVFFLTPVLTYGADYQAEQRNRPSAPVVTDFGNWSEYVAGYPPVLLIRLTPRLVEGFWTKVARGAAQTQGMAIPSIKHFTSGFSRMRAYCGDTEVAPIHPFKIERHVSETETIEEGLYVFDPGAFGPSCSSVKLTLYSQKEPAKPDTLVVDPKVIQRIWEDFAAYRALK
jgi:hypothetical protein